MKSRLEKLLTVRNIVYLLSLWIVLSTLKELLLPDSWSIYIKEGISAIVWIALFIGLDHFANPSNSPAVTTQSKATPVDPPTP